MSTRSNIAVRVKPSDYEMVNNKISAIEKYQISDENPYLEIYVHFDGYPSHMFNELKNYWNSYDKALEICMDGHTSSIADGVQQPYTSRCESYEDNKPSIFSEPCYDGGDYLYVFENNEWNIH